MKHFKVAIWNKHMLNNERKSALIGLELDRYSLDIAVLCEICLTDSGQLDEETSGYTFFWSGLPASNKRLHGVAIMLRTQIARKLPSLPQAINERLITPRLPLGNKRDVTFIGAYTPIMTNEEPVKEQFYADLNNLINKVHIEDNLIILGDFIAQVRSDYVAWPKTTGHHGIGKCN